MSQPDISTVKSFLLTLQDTLCQHLAAADGKNGFNEECWQHAAGGGGRSRVLTQGAVFEQAGVNFSHVMGATLPPSASAHRPELAGRRFQAMVVSLVIHPLNPYVPATLTYAFSLRKKRVKSRYGGLAVGSISPRSTASLKTSYTGTKSLSIFASRSVTTFIRVTKNGVMITFFSSTVTMHAASAGCFLMT